MWIFCILLISTQALATSGTHEPNRYKMNRSRLPENYDSQVFPGWYMGNATKVTLQLIYEDIWNINQKQGTYQARMHLRAAWVDHRLARNATDSSKHPKMIDCTAFFNELWRPDLYMSTEVKHETEEDKELCNLHEDGLVVWSRRFVPTIRCSMDFSYLPFDHQSCSIIVEDYSHRIDEVVLEFAEPGVLGVEDLASAEWGNFRTSHKSSQNTGRPPFVYSRAHAQLMMDRLTMGWWLTVIMPCMLFVTISYLGLWIDQHAIPARVSLDVICVLITITLIQRVSDQMPRVSYPVWITVYTTGCLFFNLITLIGFCLASWTNRALNRTKRRMAQEMEQAEHACIEEGQKNPSALDASRSLPRESLSKRMSHLAWIKAARYASRTDTAMRVVHPLAFLVFNIICFAVVGTKSS